MTKYAELRAALEQKCSAILIDDPDMIRALLAERDALRDALWVATEHNALHFGESHNTVIQGRAALAQGEA